ncbi:DUF6364 family protein [Parapedobacter soli]|uniref:DUF6364 family protein n=1 Tax=Parapedobacter soli TaxID=416955 RepID=UPI0021C71363|nr:DUF6364 family protein [Parapedobacter soli]
MSTKLTLTIDGRVIDAAKQYAREQGRSLSALVENYLKSVSNQTTAKAPTEISPKVRRLLGAVSLPDDFDYKTALTEALEEKHLK